MLEKYLQMFGKLRTDRGRDRYPEITYHRAPHKPFLLLCVMDLIAQGRITLNSRLDKFTNWWLNFSHDRAISKNQRSGLPPALPRRASHRRKTGWEIYARPGPHWEELESKLSHAG